MDCLFDILPTLAASAIVTSYTLNNAALQETEGVGLNVLYRLNRSLAVMVAADLLVKRAHNVPQSANSTPTITTAYISGL